MGNNKNWQVQTTIHLYEMLYVFLKSVSLGLCDGPLANFTPTDFND